MISCVVAVPVKILNPANFCCFFVSRTVRVPTGEQSEKKRRPCRRFTLSSQQACPCSAWIDSLVTCPRFPEWMPSSSSAHYTTQMMVCPHFSSSLNLLMCNWPEKHSIKSKLTQQSLLWRIRCFFPVRLSTKFRSNTPFHYNLTRKNKTHIFEHVQTSQQFQFSNRVLLTLFAHFAGWIHYNISWITEPPSSQTQPVYVVYFETLFFLSTSDL